MVPYKKIKICTTAGCNKHVDEGLFCPDCTKAKNELINKYCNDKIDEQTKTTLKKRIKNLKISLKKLKKTTFYKTFSILETLFEYEKKIDVTYSYRRLAVDNDMEESTVYRIMHFRYANDNTKKLVKANKIDESKVCRLLAFDYGREHQDELIKETIEKNYSYDEVEKLASKRRETVLEERTIKQKHNIVRDIINYCDKIHITLTPTNINNIPESKREIVLERLKDSFNTINASITELEKKC